MRRILDRVRMIALFTPWVSIPLMFVGVALVVTWPLVLLTSYGWICVPVALVVAVLIALWLKPRYRVSILDSSPLGVFYWLQRRY
jgi:MFS superfamily sulfate permease-like transporter